LIEFYLSESWIHASKTQAIVQNWYNQQHLLDHVILIFIDNGCLYISAEGGGRFEGQLTECQQCPSRDAHRGRPRRAGGPACPGETRDHRASSQAHHRQGATASWGQVIWTLVMQALWLDRQLSDLNMHVEGSSWVLSLPTILRFGKACSIIWYAYRLFNIINFMNFGLMNLLTVLAYCELFRALSDIFLYGNFQ